MSEKQTILGIDPGLARCGYGIIGYDGHRYTVIDYGVIATSAEDEFSKRLLEIHQQLDTVVAKYHPSIAGVEELYFCKNVKTALTVGHARGVVLLTLIQAGIPMFHFTPLQVKQAVTSYGKADKRQVQEMVRMILGMKEFPDQDDAADALAVAITCANSSRFSRFSRADHHHIRSQRP